MRNYRPAVLGALLLLVLAAATLGLGYAHWTWVLTDEGTVQTGAFEGAWTSVSCAEFHTWPDLPTHFPNDFGEAEGKDVGSTISYVDEDNPRIMHMIVDNAYPSYAVDCQVHFHNTGTIPWIIRGTTIVPTSANLENCTLSGNQMKTLTCEELTVSYADGIGSQIDPGDGSAGSVTLHVEQLADPESTYEFEVRLCVSNWNEPLAADECLAAVQ
jgi:hypothetical protein